MVFKQTVTEDGKKTCRKCKILKPLDEFVSDPRLSTGKGGRCKECSYSINNLNYHSSEIFRERSKKQRNKSMLKIRYGLTKEDVDDMLLIQQGCCLICGISLNSSSNTTRPHIDHDHRTGKIRGLLCALCNVGLGSFKDSISSLSNAICYLKDNA